MPNQYKSIVGLPHIKKTIAKKICHFAIIMMLADYAPRPWQQHWLIELQWSLSVTLAKLYSAETHLFGMANLTDVATGILVSRSQTAFFFCVGAEKKGSYTEQQLLVPAPTTKPWVLIGDDADWEMLAQTIRWPCASHKFPARLQEIWRA